VCVLGKPLLWCQFNTLVNETIVFNACCSVHLGNKGKYFPTKCTQCAPDDGLSEVRNMLSNI
jgi:hypothetical protein